MTNSNSTAATPTNSTNANANTTHNATPVVTTNATTNATPVVTTPTVSVRTHGAAEIPDSTYWTGHAIGITLTIIAIVWIFVAKGPSRKDAIKSLLEDANKKDASNSLK